MSDSNLCKKDGCNEPRIIRGKYCLDHKTGLRCKHQGCTKVPSYNSINENIAKFCSKHKKPGMIDVIHKKCQYEGCTKIPSYNLIGKIPIYCGEHKEPGMIDVINKKCKHTGCTKRPIYNSINKNIPKFCKEHKEPDMVDVKNKKCQHENCTKLPIYNSINENIPKFCKEHKEPDMIDVHNKKCQSEDCTKQPNFNYINEKTAKFCSEHKEPGMVDVKSKKCQHEGCTKQPCFNDINEKIGIYCSEHKEPDMVDVVSKRCKSDWCDTRANTKYDGYCAYCYCNLFPDSEIVKNYKTKEKAVVDFILDTFSEYTWIQDKRVVDACSKRRPDLLADFGEFVLIIEVDENCHRSYDGTCENSRLMEISQDLGHRPVIFIRMNTDGYEDVEGNKVKSCWSIKKTSGLLYINNKKQWNLRLERLKEQVEYWIENKTDKTVQIVYLFYDE